MAEGGPCHHTVAIVDHVDIALPYVVPAYPSL